MTYSEVHYGATRKSYMKSTRELAIQLMEENPTASRNKLARLYREACEDDPGYMEAVFAYASENDLNFAQKELLRRAQDAESTAKDRANEQEAVTEQLTESFDKIVERGSEALRKVVLLNLKMPNGKKLRHCTWNMSRGPVASSRCSRSESRRWVGQTSLSGMW
jgi:hypothetical protein